ncbi:hypothetical protein HPB50_005382 [Hyalomma asiaticum]|uniref:Uncharacterized protein n=1 Tax=Hyalomma asiaticum TaxID=266040 RepID=A0ACB7RJ89_HYAAI|nr:hypothetical protein HPB50_005382 [Hyalomma asiaticum]
MNTLLLHTSWLFWACAASLVASIGNETTATSCALPWRASREAYLDIPDHVFETLMRCPASLHGCSEKLVSCVPYTFASTCSCSANCKSYRDCCWDVELGMTLETPEVLRISCVQATVPAQSLRFDVYVVSGCPAAWLDGSVRAACESTVDDFYSIPATSVSSELTYRNGFCALCNGDIVSAIFWNFYREPILGEKIIVPPEFILRRPAHYLRPCADDVLKDMCLLEVPETVSQRCKTYYAPVNSGAADGIAFKNVYCALCNGANLSTLSCRPTQNWDIAHDVSPVIGLKSLAALFKPVISTRSCYAKYGGQCFIPRATEDGEKGQELTRVEVETFETLPTSERAPSDGNDAQKYTTLICVSISICCLALKLVVFCAYRESRSFASKCTLCLVVTLMITQVLHIVTSFLRVPTLSCAIGAVLVHYGLLSTFCWTCALSFDICRSLTNVTVLPNRHSVPVTYSVFSCGLPLLIVATALVVDLTLPGAALSPSYGRLVCWIGSFWGLVIYFLVPVAMLLLSCFVFYLRVVFYVRKTSLAQNDASGVRNRQRAHAVLFVRLALVMGSPWAVAFLETFLESVVLDCVVNVLAGLQGVYLFFGFKDYRYIVSSIRKRAGALCPRNTWRSSRGAEHSSAKSTRAYTDG